MKDTIRIINSSILWGLALLCFSLGIFTAIEHTTHFFANHNYLFSPFADDILDNAFYAYPVATGEKPFSYLFIPYIDHRVVIEHLQEVFDFIFTHGVQASQPYRLSILLWSNFLFFSFFVIFPNTRLTTSAKLLLSSAYLIFLFAGISINNYVSTMQITWPIVYLFALLSFICAEKYCSLANKNSHFFFIFLTILATTVCVNFTLYTFNIGSILWPIILFVLIKRRCFRQYCFIWILLIILTYYLYISPTWVAANWNSYTQNTDAMAIFHKPIAAFFYLSRCLSIPFVKDAFLHYSLPTIAIGLIVACLCLAILLYFLRTKKWSSSETIFVAYFVFILSANLIISIMRTQSPLVEWRFLTSSLLLLFCILMAFFLIRIKHPFFSLCLYIFSALWLISFLRLDASTSGGTYDVGFFNQVFISEATGIPLNNHFLQASKIYQTSGILAHHIAINEVQKKYHKGPYSFWSAQHIQHSLNDLPFIKKISAKQAELNIIYDYRSKQSPGILLNVNLENYRGPIDDKWEVIFTNQNNTIVGFAISSPVLQPLRSELIHAHESLLWRGAINTNLLTNQQQIFAWAILPTGKTMYQLGTTTIPKTIINQIEPTWIWQKTDHFGVHPDLRSNKHPW